jgi:hypothetical protein
MTTSATAVSDSDAIAATIQKYIEGGISGKAAI